MLFRSKEKGKNKRIKEDKREGKKEEKIRKERKRNRIEKEDADARANNEAEHLDPPLTVSEPRGILPSKDTKEAENSAREDFVPSQNVVSYRSFTKQKEKANG